MKLPKAVIEAYTKDLEKCVANDTHDLVSLDTLIQLSIAVSTKRIANALDCLIYTQENALNLMKERK